MRRVCHLDKFRIEVVLMSNFEEHRILPYFVKIKIDN